MLEERDTDEDTERDTDNETGISYTTGTDDDEESTGATLKYG
jgi:hypothetical protein